MQTKSTSSSAFFSFRAVLTTLIGAAACSIITGTLAAFLSSGDGGTVPQKTLIFVQRVAYQRAIEEVCWSHRIWPKGRRDAKPSLAAVMSQRQLESKVQGYLRKSQALAEY